MKVIIKKDNTVKDVNDGYARNYLLPRGLAVIATPQELAKRETQVKIEEEKRKEQIARDKEFMENIKGKAFTITTKKVGKDGKLNGAITAKEISEKTQIPRKYVQINEPIKKIGTYTIPLKIGQFHTTITLTVEKEGQNAYDNK